MICVVQQSINSITISDLSTLLSEWSMGPPEHLVDIVCTDVDDFTLDPACVCAVKDTNPANGPFEVRTISNSEHCLCSCTVLVCLILIYS